MQLLTTKELEKIREEGLILTQSWRDDWNKFAFEALGSRMDKEQRKILDSVQHNLRTSVASGTARGKDYIAGVAAICFLYLTPEWDENGVMIKNTKVALTAPTGRQIVNIMKPEFVRHFKAAHRLGIDLPGRIVANDIRTPYEEWFLTGFKADDNSTEAWTGFHAENTMFAITEASGISQLTYDAIEGNLQNNSRILLVFNPNVTVGYAAQSQRSKHWAKFRLNSMDAPNIVARKQIIPGQVNVVWLEEKLELWCDKIREDEVSEEEDDFNYRGQWYRPEDIFRVKILGKFPKVSSDSLIPQQWIELANARWKAFHEENGLEPDYDYYLRLGVDVAGMGRDSSVFCFRYGNIVNSFYKTNSGGVADHMKITGQTINILNASENSIALVDTIGEGAGVWSRALELGYEGQVYSCKYSEKAYEDDEVTPLTDLTGAYEFQNMRAYLFWAVRDWLNPKNNQNAMLPFDEDLTEEMINIRFYFKSNGKVMMEEKEDIKERIGRSTDTFDSLANTFYPAQYNKYSDKSYLAH